MKRKMRVVISLALAAAFCSCVGRGRQAEPTDTMTSGVITIAADESFAPIVAQEIDIFENTYPQASIVPIYTSEAEAIDLLVGDSVRMAITTHPLTEGQKQQLSDKKLVAREIKVATDAIALIVNRVNADSLLTMGTLRKVMSGEIRDWNQIRPGSGLGAIKLVFDNEGSSTVRYARDSVLRGTALRSDAFAQGTNEKVIDYVASDPAALGVIGVSWVGNKSDSTRLSFNDRVSVVALSHAAEADRFNSFKPYQAYMALGDYPLLRNVWILLTEPRDGLASGFTSFVCNDRGQRIFYRAGIVPATQMIRIVNVNDKM